MLFSRRVNLTIHPMKIKIQHISQNTSQNAFQHTFDGKVDDFPSKPNKLGGGFNSFEKYARQIGSFPQAGIKIENL